MSNFPEASSSISYTSPSYFSNGSNGAGVGNGSNGCFEAGTSLEVVSFSKLSSNLERLLRDSNFDCTDAEIEVDGMLVGVHRCILSARSSFFYELFSGKSSGIDDGSGNSSEEATKQGKRRYSMAKLVPLGHVGYEAFKDFLWYVYTGKLKSPDPDVSRCVDLGCAHDACRPAISFVVELMYASYTFQIEELIQLLQRRLHNFVEKAYVEDVILILLVAFHSKLTQLLDHCVQRVARSDLDKVSIQKEFPPEVVKKINSVRGIPQPDELIDEVELAFEKRIKRIHMALDIDDVHLVKLLLSESDITLDAAYGLHYAVAYCDAKVVTEILELDLANVNLMNSRGYTPLHLAAMRREPALIMSLLRKGAFASEFTRDNRSAFNICRRLTRHKDYHARSEQGKELNTDRICVDLLEQEMRRNPMAGEESSTSPSSTDTLPVKLLYLENRVALAKLFFPTQAKLAMQIAEMASKYSLFGSRGSSNNLKEVDLNETPALRAKRLRSKMDALAKTVELGRRYFPNCSQVLDKFMRDDISDLCYLEEDGSDDQDLKRQRYHEIKEDVLRAFSKDKVVNRLSGMSTSSMKADKRLHRTSKR